ncbi:MAG: GreA/GreB family elongation factor [Mariprofundaceae bacterium]|nr:GreA/GreB family elongation factor [Mariprofundaceae bacterium]
MNKQDIIDLIITQLKADIQITQQAVLLARDTATHKDCLGSSKYETMGTEASYLAKGQGERLLELQRALTYFKEVNIEPKDSIQPISFIRLQDEQGKAQLYLLASDAGGLKLSHCKQNITVITHQSPLGKALMGKQAGDNVELKITNKTVCYEIISVV